MRPFCQLKLKYFPAGKRKRFLSIILYILIGMNKKDLIIITGCDTGIGRELCKVLLNEDYNVAISYVEENPFPEVFNLYAKKMDLTIEEDIKEFALYIQEICHEENFKIGCLFNNAGIAKCGPVENTPLDFFREVMEVNYFGVVSLTQKLIPMLIESRSKVIIHGSMAGRVALPYLSTYAATKFALEGFTDSLRRELSPFGVQTVLLETGGVATPIWSKGKNQDLSFIDTKYYRSCQAFIRRFVEPATRSMPPYEAAVKILRIITRKKNRFRYRVCSNPLRGFCTVYFPGRLFDYIFQKMFKMNYGY